MAIKPYLQLVRLPNVFTAAADSLAGWLLVQGSFESPERWTPLVLASMTIYAAGIALNDLFDVDLDRAERPGRPLPSGAVSTRFAAGLAAILLGLGLGLAAASGHRTSLLVAAILVACVVAYDAGLRRTPLGPAVMGACRGLNVLLGMSQAPRLGGPSAWLVAGSLALFVAGLTWISRSETLTGRARGVAGGMAVQDLALLGLLAAAMAAPSFPAPSTDRAIVPVEGLLVLVLVALVVNLADGRAVRDPNPTTVQAAVKTGVLSLVWLNVGVVAAVRGPGPAAAVAALWVPAFVAGKWLYST
jgi:4-hydroxybenzoate polyprenyltransferase